MRRWKEVGAGGKYGGKVEVLSSSKLINAGTEKVDYVCCHSATKIVDTHRAFCNSISSFDTPSSITAVISFAKQKTVR
jgi:hypothetical protein